MPHVLKTTVLSLGILHLIKQHHQPIAKTAKVTSGKCALTTYVSYVQIQKLGTPSSIAVLHIRDPRSLLSRQCWQWSSILGKRCHQCEFTPCPAQHPPPASAADPGCRVAIRSVLPLADLFFSFWKASWCLSVDLPTSYRNGKPHQCQASRLRGLLFCFCTRLVAFAYYCSWPCLGCKLLYTV